MQARPPPPTFLVVLTGLMFTIGGAGNILISAVSLPIHVKQLHNLMAQYSVLSELRRPPSLPAADLEV